MNYKNIALISGIKTGTWLSREILSSITKMNFYEPEIIPGEKKYFDIKQLKFIPDHFYSWHIIPTKDIVDKLNNTKTKTVFIVRNIYDLVVSIYYHFYNNIDEDIGRGNNKDTFLKQFSFEEGLSLIITGFDEKGKRWNGMSEVIINSNEIFKASLHCDNILLSYNEIVSNKNNSISKIAQFLEYNLTKEEINNIEEETSFKSMKNKALINKRGASHFREGSLNKNRTKLSYFHQIQLRKIIKEYAPDIYENAKKVGMEDIVLYK